MKLLLQAVGVFLFVFVVYFAIGTAFSFHPKWFLDYFNPLANALLHLRWDIVNPGQTYDLIHYQSKWYAPWGILAALPFIPIQLVLHRFVPSFYIAIFFASINIAVFYLLLLRVKREFFPQLSWSGLYIVLVLFAFGTTNIYVGTLGSSWHVDQIVSTAIATCGIYVVFKKKRRLLDYFLSSIIFSFLLIGRPTFVFLLSLPFFLYIWEYIFEKKKIAFALKRGVLIFILPGLFFSALFFAYNFFRFGNVFEYGYSHIQESPYLKAVRETNGAVGMQNLPQNLWYMLFEIPNVTLSNGKPAFHINLLGNSIFFLTPPFFAIFLASPFQRIRKKIVLDPYVSALWIAAIITMLPSLLIYSTGWMQFGYRYSLDITVLLTLLAVFGVKGKINILFVMGTICAVILYLWGIRLLM